MIMASDRDRAPILSGVVLIILGLIMLLDDCSMAHVIDWMFLALCIAYIASGIAVILGFRIGRLFGLFLNAISLILVLYRIVFITSDDVFDDALAIVILVFSCIGLLGIDPRESCTR